MNELGPGSTPEIKTSYPHMMAEDYEIWIQFLKNGMYLPDLCWYDVRVGAGWPIEDDAPDWKKKFVEASTRKRIDIVWSCDHRIWVVEVKPDAAQEALGQVLYYAEDFRNEYPQLGEIIPAVVTDLCDQDVFFSFEKYGVVVFEVGPPKEGE